ncbi:MAG: Peptidoglycan-N-acetylmuramic acid deacetylase PdaA precursor [Syntrophaceae bacterium PtaB.Bin038]|jgi:peptidoglycan/xylan/chitin deacetylase (PgdA/CDA1 family)|nr:MAG: Peptidoglycan-N-acetylmuramic acid deacetylase PdaA precursor [Syntrophaceae bacterium PtaB.Bin038]
MKTAFLIVLLLLLAPCEASGSGPGQPPAKDEGAIREAAPPVQVPPAAPVVRRKVRYPGEPATATAPARAQAPKASPCPGQLRKQQIVAAYRNRAPGQWGERVEGVRTRLDTEEPVVALTFDACGGPRGSRADTALIEYLQQERIPATLFVSGRWIDANPALFKRLAAEPLFEIANHGLAHRPCSVNGKSAYGIKGTASVAELVDEIEKNGKKIEAATGRRPRFYRPGTAYCDEVAVKVAGELGYEVVNYTVLGDAGATWPQEKVRQALLEAGHGAIVILHMNQPRSRTAAGVMEAVPLLREKGLRFVKLSEYPLR